MAARWPATADHELDDDVYRSLAEFRFHVRRFFDFSERALADAGVPPLQYQAMLAIRAHGAAISVGELAGQLFLRINTTSELLDRMARAGLIRRTSAPGNRRRVEVTLTAQGSRLLARLAALHHDQHRRHLADLAAVVGGLAGAGR